MVVMIACDGHHAICRRVDRSLRNDERENAVRASDGLHISLQACRAIRVRGNLRLQVGHVGDLRLDS